MRFMTEPLWWSGVAAASPAPWRCHEEGARVIVTTDDVAGAVLSAMTNSFLTGVTLTIDGGEPLT
jgi:hypothetical protein